MSRSKAYRSPFCHPCRTKHLPAKRSYPDLPYNRWDKIEFLRSTKKGGYLRCQICGHKWYSQSRFAREQGLKQQPILILNIKGGSE